MKYDEELQKAMPRMTLSQVRGFLTYYLAYIHHMKPTQGLGELGTFEGVPADLWREGISRAPATPLIDPEIFVRVAGQYAEVSISKKGFVWDDVTYVSPELLFLSTQRSSKGRKFKARRSPWNLRVAWIQDPYAKTERWIEVPAAPADQPYANGLRCYEHRWIKKYLRKKSKKAVNAKNLLAARTELAKAVIAAHRAHSTIKTGRTLAALYERTLGEFAMSRRYAVARSEFGPDHVDLASPAVQEAPPPLSSRAGLVAPFQMPDRKQHAPLIGPCPGSGRGGLVRRRRTGRRPLRRLAGIGGRIDLSASIPSVRNGCGERGGKPPLSCRASDHHRENPCAVFTFRLGLSMIENLHRPVKGGLPRLGATGSLLGESRCGKTTICRAYVDQHPPRDGETGMEYSVVYLDASVAVSRKRLGQKIQRETGCPHRMLVRDDPGEWSVDRLLKCRTELLIVDDA